MTPNSIRAVVVVFFGVAVAVGVGVPLLGATDYLVVEIFGVLITAVSALVAVLGAVTFLTITFPSLTRSTHVTDAAPPAAGPDKALD